MEAAPGRIVGLDVGDRRIGVAVSDPLGITAQPREVVEHDADVVARIVGAVGATVVVAGLPLDQRGEVGRQARRVLAFLDRLRERLPGVRIETWDERFSTAHAQRSLLEGGVRRARRRQVVDMVAAALILQSWMDAHGDTGPGRADS